MQKQNKTKQNLRQSWEKSVTGWWGDGWTDRTTNGQTDSWMAARQLCAELICTSGKVESSIK